MKLRSYFILLMLVVGCGKSTEEDLATSNKRTPSSAGLYSGEEIVYEGDFTVIAPQNYELDLGLNLDNYLVEVLNTPKGITFDGKSLVIDLVMPGVYENIIISATSKVSGEIVEFEPFSIGVNTDPLYSQLWFIKNISQKSFSLRGGVSGIDINVSSTYRDQIYGTGIKIVVSDTSAQTDHEDLFGNMRLGLHKDFNRSYGYVDGFVTPKAHATSVSGIIGAVGWNNIGTRGVAPKAKISVYNFIDSNQSLRATIAQASGDADIFNYSYGDFITHDTLSDSMYLDHLKYMNENARNGNGAIFVKASGNEGVVQEKTLCTSHNANAPLENESPYVITVGAIDADGNKAAYSSSGSNLWVSAPGGEYGLLDPAIVSTDLTTCSRGYSVLENLYINDFEGGEDLLNADCHYTSTMNGTSAAAPIVSGAIALLLEANPNLSSRDVKHILAVSSRKIDPDSIAFPRLKHPSNFLSGCTPMNLNNYQYELPWVKNSRGLWYHNYYGFGLVDVEKAVELAKDFSKDPLEMLPLKSRIELNRDFTQDEYTIVAGETIPDANAQGIVKNLTIDRDFVLEAVQLKIEIDHPASGEVGIELISPAMTKSILLNINNSFLLDGDKDLKMVLLSNAFYGENIRGEWQIRIVDGNENNQGIINKASLNFIGQDV